MKEITLLEALGNKFVLCENLSKKSTEEIRTIAKTYKIDQLISFETALADNDLAFVIRFYNYDGSQAGACGNGSRVAVGFYAKQTGKTYFSFGVEKENGDIQSFKAWILSDNSCKTSMEKPFFKKRIDCFLNGYFVDIGNPHHVMIMDNMEDLLQKPTDALGLILQDFFDNGVNVEWICIKDKHNIRMRVYERGVGVTKSCGTGACASAITAIELGKCETPVTVECDGGNLTIDYDKNTKELYLSGEC